jgi:transcriptional regulator with XRE-family HTH domain
LRVALAACHEARMDDAVPSPDQCRAARGLLDWSRAQLSKRSGVSVRAIAAFELRENTLISANRKVIRQAFERAGVEFTSGDGVRRRDGAK